MKVFVSQPVFDKDPGELSATHDEVLSAGLRHLGLSPAEAVEVPMIGPAQLSGQHPVYCLGLNLQMMCQADVVLFHPDWFGSRACRLEHVACEEYGIQYLDVEEWM